MKTVGGRGSVTWIPGMPDEDNLGGTTRTLDGVSGETPLKPGLLSRSGWVVYDDSLSPVLARVPTASTIPKPSGAEGVLRGTHIAHSELVMSGGEASMWEGELWPVPRTNAAVKDWYFFGHGVC